MNNSIHQFQKVMAPKAEKASTKAQRVSEQPKGEARDSVSISETRSKASSVEPKLPALHVSLRVPLSMVGQLAESALIMVPEEQIQGDQWVGKKEDGFEPRVLDATFTKDIQKSTDEASILPNAVGRSLLNDELQESDFLVLDRGITRQGQSLKEAVDDYQEPWILHKGEDAHLTVSLDLNQEQRDRISGKRIAFVSGDEKDKGYAPDYYNPIWGLEGVSESEVPLLEMRRRDGLLYQQDPTVAEWDAEDRAIAQSATVKNGEETFQLEITQAAVKALNASDVGLDFQNGLLVKGGEYVDTVSSAEDYLQATGQEPPVPWLARTPKNQLFAIPTKRLVLGFEDGKLTTELPQGGDVVGTMVPEANKEYTVGEHTGQPVKLRFDQRAVDFFKSHGMRFDLENACLVRKDGRVDTLDDRANLFGGHEEQKALLAGQKIPPTESPWSFNVPRSPGIHGKAREIRFEGEGDSVGMVFFDERGKRSEVESERPADDRMGLRLPFEVKRTNRHTSIMDSLGDWQTPTATELSGIQPRLAEKPYSRISFEAPNHESLQLAIETFEYLLGDRAREERVIDREALKDYMDTVRRVMSTMGEPSEEPAVLLQRYGKAVEHPEAMRIGEKLLGETSEGMSGVELNAKIGEKILRASPVKITVVPDNVPAEAYIQGSDFVKGAAKDGGPGMFICEAPFSRDDGELPTQHLYIYESLLKDEKTRNTVYVHELMHLYEASLYTPEEQDENNRSYSESSEFQSVYGANRLEYLPTLSEEFQGAHGSDGPAWVKSKHPKVYRLLSRLTRTDPATA